MKRFKIPETGNNVILKSKKTDDYKEIKIVEVEDEFYAIFSNDEKVAEAIYEDDSCAVIIDDDKKEYVRNTRSRYYENLYKKDLEKVRSRPYPEPPKDERW